MMIFKESKATLKDYMGNDLMVANAARVSFLKESTLDEQELLKMGDQKLISFLAREKHIMPFAHPQIQFHIQAPIFVARQLHKHQVGGVVSEVSYRYIKPYGAFYPDAWREEPDNKKQGSKQNTSIDIMANEHDYPAQFDPVIESYEKAFETYEYLLEKKVCAEQARMVLPLATMTEWTWTGSLLFWDRLCGLRLKADTQKESRDVAQQISDIIEPLFPYSWEALQGK